MMSFAGPKNNCDLCVRLCEYRESNKNKYSSYHNAPVPSFGSLDAEVLVVGLAPGLHGANQTGRPFTNDYAGDILYPALKKMGFAEGNYLKKKDDGFDLLNVRITNAVRCVPPENKPTTMEEKTCRNFLIDEIGKMKNLKVILCLGTISHKNVLATFNVKQSMFKFKHGCIHELSDRIKIVDSYHTSRYNINTGVLTEEMFDEIIKKIKGLI
jgi:uracil-DNA glycosylase family 4